MKKKKQKSTLMRVHVEFKQMVEKKMQPGLSGVRITKMIAKKEKEQPKKQTKWGFRI